MTCTIWIKPAIIKQKNPITNPDNNISVEKKSSFSIFRVISLLNFNYTKIVQTVFSTIT
jgi:hypothetical protein